MSDRRGLQCLSYHAPRYTILFHEVYSFIWYQRGAVEYTPILAMLQLLMAIASFNVVSKRRY